MKHADLVQALKEAGIPLLPAREDMNKFTAKSGNLYLTWDEEGGEVKDLNSTPYTGTDQMELPAIDYTLITYHKTIKAAIKRLKRAAAHPVVPLPEGVPAKLLWVEGEGAAEFADLIGSSGKLSKTRKNGLQFDPDADQGMWGWLVIDKPQANKDGDKLRVTSGLGNTFVFRELTT